jgi:membrane protein
VPSPIAAVKSGLSRARERRPLLDHLVRTVQRYQADAGERLAAAVTFYWFLSLFPLLLVAVWVTSLVLGDDAGAQVTDGLADVLPADLAATIGEVVRDNAGQAGLVGVGGLVLSGLGWVDALREAVRTVWHQNVLAGNLVVRKAVDVLVLVGLFGTIAGSVLVSGLVTGFTSDALDLLGVQDTAAARVGTRLVGYALLVLVDTVVFLYLFTRLARVRTPWRRVLKGAVFGAVGFEVLKVLGGLYVERSTSKGEATYGAFAVVVGLLLFLNLVSRLLLLTAAFVVTAPYDSDVAPSGTASPEQARKAGIPPEYADGTPDDPPAILDDGAPTPLQAAVQGRTAPQHEDDGSDRDTGRSWSRLRGSSGAPGAADQADRSRAASEPGGRPVSAPTVPALAGVPVGSAPDDGRGERAVRLAASAGIGAVGVLLLAVLAHLAGTVRRLLR